MDVYDNKNPRRKSKRKRIKKVKISKGYNDSESIPGENFIDTALKYLITFDCEEEVKEENLDAINYIDVRNTPIGDFPQLQQLGLHKEDNTLFTLEAGDEAISAIYDSIVGLLNQGIYNTPISIYFSDGEAPVMETYLVELYNLLEE